MNGTSDGQTFRTLNGRLGWHTNRATGISVSVPGLRLAALPNGTLSLGWSDGSLGGLILPRAMAADARGGVYLLDPDGAAPDGPQRVRRYDRATRSFVALPALGGRGTDARRFHSASNISIAGPALFIADEGNRRIQVVLLDTLQLLYVWPLGAGGDSAARVDVASRQDTTYVLDGPNGRVLRHVRGQDNPVPFIRIRPGVRQWSRIAVDRDERVYLLDAAQSLVDVYDRRGIWLQRVTDAGDVRDRFDPPAVTLIFDARGGAQGVAGYFRLPDALASAGSEELLFDRCGRRVRIPRADFVEPMLYRKHGTWISEAIDSGIHACQWHRLDVAIPRLPAGTQAVVSTFTSDVPSGHPHEGSPQWQPCLKVWGTTRQTAGSGVDALVQSREGQYLWISVELAGDGFDTPVVGGIDAHFPRDSYLRYLPAVYAADDESRWFLERFLSIVQTEWDAIDARVRDVRRYFDVDAAPAAGGWLETIGRWMAVPLEQTWTAEQKRNLLRVSKRLLGRRGTPRGLRDFVQAYLQNMTGLSPDRQGNWPVILEGFRERHRVLVGATREGRLGAGVSLWSDGVVGRPQLDVFTQEGSMRLVSTGDPGRDLFHQYSHRFTVTVPAAWVRTEAHERMLRRAIDAEKPAHAAYDLRLVAARFRVGVQSTVGVDTILGGQPRARLEGGCGSDAAPSRPPRSRLGYDTVLGGHSTPDGPLQIPRSRIGLDTILN